MNDHSTDPNATGLADLLGRIERHDGVAATPTPPLTGHLADLHGWWSSMGRGAALTPVRVPTETAFVADLSDDPVAAILAGARAADRAIDAGATLIIPRVPQRDDLTARTVIALLTRREANRVVGQPDGLSDAAWMERCAAVRDLCAPAASLLGDYPALLASVHASAIAFTAGTLLGAAARLTPCLIDGTDEWAAALVADRLQHSARTWWRSATTSPDPAQVAACERIGLEPGVPLGLSDDDGLGADAVVTLLRLADSSSD